MSTTTETATTSRRQRASAEAATASASTGNGSASALPETTTIDINGTAVALPNRFSAMVGQPLTDDMAKIIFAHVAGQFRNNQTANAKAREARYAKAETEEGRAENAPLGVDDYLKIWADYMPQVGGGPRLSSMDKLRLEAAKRAWAQLISDHNAALDAGLPPVLKSDKKQAVAPRPVKTKNISTEQHEANVQAWQDKQDAIYKRLLETPTYADRIQAQLDLLMAESGRKAQVAEAATADADLI